MNDFREAWQWNFFGSERLVERTCKTSLKTFLTFPKQISY